MLGYNGRNFTLMKVCWYVSTFSWISSRQKSRLLNYSKVSVKVGLDEERHFLLSNVLPLCQKNSILKGLNNLKFDSAMPDLDSIKINISYHFPQCKQWPHRGKQFYRENRACSNLNRGGIAAHHIRRKNVTV